MRARLFVHCLRGYRLLEFSTLNISLGNKIDLRERERGLNIMDWNEDLEYDLQAEDDADRYFRGLDCDDDEDDFLDCDEYEDDWNRWMEDLRFENDLYSFYGISAW